MPTEFGVLGKIQVNRPKEGLQFKWEDVASLKEKEHIEKLLKWDGQGFDLRTHITDPATGILVKYQPYRREVTNQEVIYYRRDESGIERRYSESGNLLDSQRQNQSQQLHVKPEGKK
jgi:hypothetical protein